jgi:hypothetical protein
MNIITILESILGLIKLITRTIIADMHYYLLVMRRIIIEKVIAPIIELATFGFIRLVRIEEE